MQTHNITKNVIMRIIAVIKQMYFSPPQYNMGSGEPE